MKNNTTTKKVWQKPEVSDLDVSRETSTFGKSSYHGETGSFGPAAS